MESAVDLKNHIENASRQRISEAGPMGRFPTPDITAPVLGKSGLKEAKPDLKKNWNGTVRSTVRIQAGNRNETFLIVPQNATVYALFLTG